MDIRSHVAQQRRDLRGLRSRVIRLAQQRRDLRVLLLPLLKSASGQGDNVIKQMVLLFKDPNVEPGVSPALLNEVAKDLREDIQKLGMAAKGGRLSPRMIVMFAQNVVLFVQTLSAMQHG